MPNWRLHGVAADLVILVSSGSTPTSSLPAWLLDVIACSDPGALIDKPSGIFLLAADGVGEAGKVLLQAFVVGLRFLCGVIRNADGPAMAP